MLNTIVQIIAIAGFLLSAYAFYVEWKHSKSKTYKPICDINDQVSCTKTFSSPYGKLALLPNSIYGMIFFLIIFVLGLFGQMTHIIYLSMFAVPGTVYLAYVMFFKVRTLCLVCVGVYCTVLLLHLASMQGAVPHALFHS
ncbi:MAG: vitamin K epoxide reductase family protein [bacterium]|nr:vitamin K epoxide reductase family protein [bacterium]MDZ4296376.1 vitamin K epoxide reductase family protein [Patescibacteria group bacterium]